jgi:hypothetical protein
MKRVKRSNGRRMAGREEREGERGGLEEDSRYEPKTWKWIGKEEENWK